MPSSSDARIDALGTVFIRVIEQTNSLGRAHLTSIVDYCDSRRAQGLDTRAMPVIFYTLTDAAVQAAASPHLPQVPPTHPPQGLQSPSLHERRLSALMDPASRNAYLRARYQCDRSEASSTGTRYLAHLQNPSLPQPPACVAPAPSPSPPNPAAHAALDAPPHDLDAPPDETHPGDEESDYDDSDVESAYTEMSLVTRECDDGPPSPRSVPEPDVQRIAPYHHYHPFAPHLEAHFAAQPPQPPPAGGTMMRPEADARLL